MSKEGEKEIVLYPNRLAFLLQLLLLIQLFLRNATVADLFEEARTSGSLDIEEGGTGVLRMVEIISCKIFSLRFYWS